MTRARTQRLAAYEKAVEGGVQDETRLASLVHQRQHAAKRLVEMLSQLENECASIRHDIERRGAECILRTPGNVGASAGRVEAALEAMKAIREACEIAGVPS
jgi:hypothetical protein